MYTSGTPNAASASRCAVLMAWPSSCAVRTTRMPRPPPPAVALTMTGKPHVSANFSASSSFSTGPSVPGSSGRPAFFIARRARALSPIRRITFGSGPMNRMWHASHTSARYADSDRNPYPGWIASAPVISAALMIAGTFR